jgi:hypothetical protein
MKYILGVVLLFFSLTAVAEDATIFISVGTSVSNSVKDTKSNAWGVEQETPTSWGIWKFGYLNEGHKHGDKRDGIYGLYKIPYRFTEKIETSFSIGPYFTATTVTAPDGIHYRDAYCWSALPRAEVKYNITENYKIAASWSHVLYARNNQDADVFLISIGYTP